MPYANASELPANVKAKLKGKRRRQFMHVWNSSYDRHKDESRAFAEAWATVQKGIDMAAAETFNFFLPLAKIDKDKRTVSGYASTPAVDLDGEIVSLDAVKKALPGYWEWRNIREMHTASAVGVAKEANVDEKGMFLTAKVVDNDAWQKCLDEVYKGFSIGGRKLAKNGNIITEIELIEVSLVDRPANPECRFEIQKSAKVGGNAYLVKPQKPFRDPASRAVTQMAKAVKTLAKAGPPAARDGFSLPAKVTCKAHGNIDCAECAYAAKRAEEEKQKQSYASAEKQKAKDMRRLAKRERKALAKLSQLELTPATASAEPSFLTLDADSGTVGSPVEKGTKSVVLLPPALELGGGRAAEPPQKDGSNVDGFLQYFSGKGYDMAKENDTNNDQLGKALLDMLKAGRAPSRAQRLQIARGDLKKARGQMKECEAAIKAAHAMHKQAYLAKAAKGKAKPDDKDDDFDHAGAMEKLQKAYGSLTTLKTFVKAANGQLKKAASRAGQREQEPGTGVDGFYQVPQGVKELSPSDHATAGVGGDRRSGSEPSEYPVDRPFPGKAAKRGFVTTSEAEALARAAAAEARVDVMEKMPMGTVAGRKPYAFDVTKFAGGEANKPDVAELFKGVDPNALSSNDEATRTNASATVIGNMITSGRFGKSVFDPSFHGVAGTKN